MTTKSTTAEDRLAALGIRLPDAFGVASLPLGSPAELEVILEVRTD